jgi:hypothetical protein
LGEAILYNSSGFSMFMDADVATEHSKQCCEWLVEGGAISKLLQLIPTINRSPPHEQVLKHALSILANLARFPSLAFSIASEMDSTNIIVEQLLIFRYNITTQAAQLIVPLQGNRYVWTNAAQIAAAVTWKHL